MNVIISKSKVFIDNNLTKYKLIDQRNRFIFTDYVTILKYDAIRTDGHTRREIYMWENIINDEDKIYFSPIIYHGEFNNKSWAIFPYYTSNEAFRPLFTKLVRSLFEKYELLDFQKSNWLVTTSNELKIVDYGL